MIDVICQGYTDIDAHNWENTSSKVLPSKEYKPINQERKYYLAKKLTQ